MNKILLGCLIGFFTITVIALLLFFTVIKNKMCKGEFVKCPSGNVSICAKEGTNAGQFCPKKTGVVKNINNLRQNNNQQVASDMSIICGGSDVSIDSQAVKCALELSAYETGFQGDPLFGERTGFRDDEAQDKWCLGIDPGIEPNYDLSQFTPGNCP